MGKKRVSRYSLEFRRIAVERAEDTRDACRRREPAIEQRQSFDGAASDRERGVNRIDAVEPELLKRRFETDPAHLGGEPLSRHAVDFGAGAMKALPLVGVDHCADAVLHALLQLAGRCGKVLSRP